MNTLVFTICARNYIGLSKVLEQSIARHGAGVDFRIYVAEGLEGMDTADDGTILSAPIALAPYIDASEYANMAFMYNVTEFCTSLKAACFMHGFADGYEKCIYMDPDIFVVDDLALITRELDDSAILMTPHLCLPALGEGPRRDRGILATGTYNLGFLGLRSDHETDRFLQWWHERLREQAFNDHYNALYTDQRWMDFVPSLFSGRAVRIWRHLGCNVAPWNYHERRIVPAGDTFIVHPRNAQGNENMVSPLVFLHFSGFDFRRILDGRFDQLNLADAETHADLLPLYARYGDAIQSVARQMEHYLALPYGFDRFADGTPILPSHRRLFRVWRERHGNAADPFATGSGSFHAALGARGLLGRENGSDVAADKATLRSVADAGKLLARAHTVFRLIFRVLGRSRFFFLVRSLNRLANVEQHYDTFSLDKANIKTTMNARDVA
ncbi:hypothetical protein ACG3SL_21265 (plasmid) [Sphingomonas sp. CJ20]